MKSSIDGKTPLLSETLRGGQSWSRTLRRGQRLSMTDRQGNASVAALFYNADQLSERYNMPDTLKAQHIARLTTGYVIYSDMGRVLCSIVDDTLGWHDTMTGHADAKLSEARYGRGSYQELRNGFYRNTRDNLLVELGKYDLGKRDLVPNVNFFVKVQVDDLGRLEFIAGHSGPGSFVVLRADMNVLVILSNTPHPLGLGERYAPPDVELELHAGEPAASNDACRLSRPENARGFELTESYFL